MTLKEQFKKEIIAAPVMDEVIDYWVSELEQVAEEFAIGFAEWLNGLDINDYVLQKHISSQELLEMYKKEKGL
jgi:hypothetical protein